MSRYVLKRLILMIPVMCGVVLLVFSMLELSPGNPEDYILGDMATEDDKALFRAEHGLDDPFIVKYLRYLVNILRGDLGTSYTTKQPVLKEILQRFPISIRLAGFSTIVALVVGIFFGIISAVKQYSLLDNITRVIAMVGVSMPHFWFGLMLILVFSVYLGWLPSGGIGGWKGWVLPSLTIGLGSSASIMRMTRSSMLDSIRQDYISTARSKGQKESVVIMKHAFRNAIIPVITIAGINFGRSLGGSAVVEIVFTIPGLGQLIVNGIQVKNAPLVQGGILFVSFAMSIINLIVDILYAYIDPRVRSEYKKASEKPNVSQSVEA